MHCPHSDTSFRPIPFKSPHRSQLPLPNDFSRPRRRSLSSLIKPRVLNFAQSPSLGHTTTTSLHVQDQGISSASIIIPLPPLNPPSPIITHLSPTSLHLETFDTPTKGYLARGSGNQPRGRVAPLRPKAWSEFPPRSFEPSLLGVSVIWHNRYQTQD